jgi:hypothetical protein
MKDMSTFFALANQILLNVAKTPRMGRRNFAVTAVTAMA